MGRPRETDFETMSREALVLRLLNERLQWRDRAMRFRERQRSKARTARLRQGRSDRQEGL
jgi:hypothetical protein